MCEFVGGWGVRMMFVDGRQPSDVRCKNIVSCPLTIVVSQAGHSLDLQCFHCADLVGLGYPDLMNMGACRVTCMKNGQALQQAHSDFELGCVLVV